MDKFNNIPLSVDEHNDLFSFDREALENFHWVSIAKSKGLGENYEVMMIASHTYPALSSYWSTKSYFSLQESLKTRINSKYQSKGPMYILHLLTFVQIRLFNVIQFLGKKNGIWDSDEKGLDAGFS